MADFDEAAYEAFDLFIETYQAKHPTAAECPQKDEDELLASYDFPAEHCGHLRTPDPIENVFATVKYQQKKTCGNGTRVTCLVTVFKPTQTAAMKRRALKASLLLAVVIEGIPYINVVKENEAAA